jgi:hypothetical protein
VSRKIDSRKPHFLSIYIYIYIYAYLNMHVN